MSWRKWFPSPDHRPARRAFLGGAAATVALPFLPSMMPRSAWAQDPGEAVRMLWYFVPNGLVMNEWTPETTGAGFALKSIMQPLAAFQDELLVLSGLTNAAGYAPRPGDHARGTGAALTCSELAFEGISNGISIDQAIAQAAGSATTFPSLQLGLDVGETVGLCDSGYSCAYPRNISWAGPTSPMPKMTSPRVIFNRMFGGFDVGLTEAERARRAVYRTSLLDNVTAEATSLSGRLGVADRAKLDQYLTGVRELETRLERGETGTCSPTERPGEPPDYESHLRSMTDLMVLSLSCDLTRYISFMLGNGGSNQSYGFIGAPGAHHEISHHGGDPELIEKLRLIDIWEMEQVACLLQALRDTPSGSATLLDHTMVCVLSEISDGDSHSHHDLPVLLAGRAGGAVAPGRHVAFDNAPPIANLFLSMAHTAGVPLDRFADSTGPLEGLAG